MDRQEKLNRVSRYARYPVQSTPGLLSPLHPRQVNRNARPKRILNDGSGSRRHKRITQWVSKACFSNKVQPHFELMPSIDGLYR